MFLDLELLFEEVLEITCLRELIEPLQEPELVTVDQLRIQIVMRCLGVVALGSCFDDVELSDLVARDFAIPSSWNRANSNGQATRPTAHARAVEEAGEHDVVK